MTLLTYQKEFRMETYKVGGLSQLFSESSGETIDELFKSKTITTSKDEDDKFSSLPKTKAPKKRKSEKQSKVQNDEDDDTPEVKFTQPSKKFKVQQEEMNRKKPKNEETEKRTVFVGNLPTEITAKKLKKHFEQFGTIETVRFRGAARPDLKTTKKQAIIQKKFHEKRNSLIAYVRFKEESSAKQSVQLNGTSIEDKVLRVDLACKSEETVDQSKAIFVGNVPFDIDEDAVIKHFTKCGKIESVRIVRDAKSGIGKGFCYVNFYKRAGVKLAIDLMNGTLLSGRELRVSKSVERPKKTVKMIPDLKSKGPYPHKKETLKKLAQKKAVILKKKKKDLKPSFEGVQVAGGEGNVAKKKKGNGAKKLGKKKKLIAKQFG